LLADELVAEAIKALFETYHNKEGKDTLTEVTEHQARQAVEQYIKIDIAGRPNQAKKADEVDGTVVLKDVTTDKGVVVHNARVLAGRLGLDTEKVVKAANTLQAVSTAGKLTIPNQGAPVKVTITSFEDQGHLNYQAKMTGDSPTCVTWDYIYLLEITATRADNGDTVRVEVYRKGVATGSWGPGN
jgi:hypothetical protein